MLIDWLAGRARLTPESVAVIEPHRERELTYRQVNQRADNLAVYLSKAGIGIGDRVAYIAQNSLEHLDFMFASNKIGAIFVPLNWRMKQAELEAILADSQPKLLAYQENHFMPFF